MGNGRKEFADVRLANTLLAQGITESLAEQLKVGRGYPLILIA